MIPLETVHLRKPINGYIPIDPETTFVPKFRWDPSKVETANISRYADDKLDLDIGILQVNIPSSNRYITFSDYDASLREIVRAFAWCGMNIDHSAFEGDARSIAPAKLKDELRLLARYLRFMATRGKGMITDDDNDAWLAQFKSRSYSTRVRATLIPRRLHWYRFHLPFDIMACQPWSDRTVPELLGPRPQTDENSTERVPREILEPLMRWTLFYLNVAALDIFALFHILPMHCDFNRPAFEKKFAFRAIPGTSTPWQNAWDYRPSKEVGHLVVACYIISAYLSGMRDGEVQSILRGKWGVKKENGRNSLPLLG